jgi:hypothetical protein
VRTRSDCFMGISERQLTTLDNTTQFLPTASDFTERLKCAHRKLRRDLTVREIRGVRVAVRG